MERFPLKQLISYLGPIGAGCLISGAVLYVMQEQSTAYWISFLTIGLFLTILNIVLQRKKFRAFINHRSTKEGANSVAFTCIILAIATIFLYIANRHSKQWDFTETQQYSLSEQTKKIITELDRDVSIVQLDRQGTPQQTQAADLLDLYANASRYLNIEFIDPEANPTTALKYTNPTQSIDLGTILVTTTEQQHRAAAATEVEITRALIRALKNEKKKIYFTSGHKEKLHTDEGPNGISVVVSKLSASVYEINPLIILRSLNDGEVQIPKDASALIIAGPQTDFLNVELAALDQYLLQGGAAIFLIDPVNQSETLDLVTFLAERGIVLGNDVVVDALAQQPVYPVVQSYSDHPIVASFKNTTSLFALARSVTASDNLSDGTKIQELFTTLDDNSWAETALDELTERQGPKEGQALGPIGLGVAATTKHQKTAPESRIVVVGDSDFIANELATAPILNTDLFLNMVNWVVEDDELISIRPRNPEERRVAMTFQQRKNVFFLTLFVFPGVVILTALSVWRGKRS